MTKLIPQNIEWTIANGKIIKKVNNNTFAEVDAADITALWFATSIWWNTVFISPTPFSVSTWINTITHNLWLTQVDIESWRYLVKFSFKRTVWWTYWAFSETPDVSSNDWQRAYWSASNPALPAEVYFQANTLKFYINTNVWTDYRVHIIKNF